MPRTTMKDQRTGPAICPACECVTTELAARQCRLAECPLPANMKELVHG